MHKVKVRVQRSAHMRAQQAVVGEVEERDLTTAFSEVQALVDRLIMCLGQEVPGKLDEIWVQITLAEPIGGELLAVAWGNAIRDLARIVNITPEKPTRVS